jgi:hypothetical protein
MSVPSITAAHVSNENRKLAINNKKKRSRTAVDNGRGAQSRSGGLDEARHEAQLDLMSMSAHRNFGIFHLYLSISDFRTLCFSWNSTLCSSRSAMRLVMSIYPHQPRVKQEDANNSIQNARR